MILPLWLLCTVMVGGSTAASIAALWFVRRTVAPRTLREHHDVAGFILAIVGVIYAVLLAFAVLVVWERFGAAEIVAEREANALIDVYHLAPGLTKADEVKVRAGAHEYAKRVIEAEWPSMSYGKIDLSTSAAIDHIWSDLLVSQIKGEKQSEVYSQLLDRLTDVGDNRRLRLLASRTGVPGPMWMVLVVGGMATLLFTFYFGLERFSVQAGMTAILATLIALVLFLISALNYPFTGGLKVQPEAMQTALSRFETVDRQETLAP